MTKYIDELHDRIERARIVGRWRIRFKRLRKKKQPNGRMFSMTTLCQKYGLRSDQICNAMSGRRGLEWETINRVEDALKKEGV